MLQARFKLVPPTLAPWHSNEKVMDVECVLVRYMQLKPISIYKSIWHTHKTHGGVRLSKSNLSLVQTNKKRAGTSIYSPYIHDNSTFSAAFTIELNHSISKISSSIQIHHVDVLIFSRREVSLRMLLRAVGDQRLFSICCQRTNTMTWNIARIHIVNTE